VQTDRDTRLSGLIYNPSYLLFPGGIHGAAGQNNTPTRPYMYLFPIPTETLRSLTPLPSLFMTVAGTESFLVANR